MREMINENLKPKKKKVKVEDEIQEEENEDDAGEIDESKLPNINTVNYSDLGEDDYSFNTAQ